MNTKVHFHDGIKYSNINENISRPHIVSYLDRSRFGIFLALLFISLSDLIMYLLIKSEILDLSLSSAFIKSRCAPDYVYIGLHFIIQNILNWIIFGISLVLYNKVGFKGKKIIISLTFMLITTIYSFGNWGYIYLSILYVIPVIFTCPLGKKYRLNMLVLCIIMTIIYGFYQNALIKSGYHLLIAVISITAIVATYFISGCIYTSFTKAIHDIEEYSKLSDELYDEIAHDFVTGAFSKAALHKDITEKLDFKSVAFIDLDDFKEINDTLGHSMGDNVLRNLVKCFQKKNEQIYRYGGDEFIILSKLKVDELAKEMSEIKKSYTLSCYKLYKCSSTFSAGVMEIDNAGRILDMENILSQSDKIMYAAKQNGKDQILVGA